MFADCCLWFYLVRRCHGPEKTAMSKKKTKTKKKTQNMLFSFYKATKFSQHQRKNHVGFFGLKRNQGYLSDGKIKG